MERHTIIMRPASGRPSESQILPVNFYGKVSFAPNDGAIIEMLSTTAESKQSHQLPCSGAADIPLELPRGGLTLDRTRPRWGRL